MTAKTRHYGVSLWIWSKIQQLNTNAGELFGQLFSSPPPKEMKLQPVQNKKISQSNVLLMCSALAAATLFSSCSNTVPTTDSVQAGQADRAGAGEIYQTMIGDYKISSAANLTAYNQDDFIFRAAMMPDVSNAYQQTIDTLRHQQNNIKLKIDNFQDDGKQSWEVFRTALNRDIDIIQKTLNDSTIIRQDFNF